MPGRGMDPPGPKRTAANRSSTSGETREPVIVDQSLPLPFGGGGAVEVEVEEHRMNARHQVAGLSPLTSTAAASEDDIQSQFNGYSCSHRTRSRVVDFGFAAANPTTRHLSNNKDRASPTARTTRFKA